MTCEVGKINVKYISNEMTCEVGETYVKYIPKKYDTHKKYASIYCEENLYKCQIYMFNYYHFNQTQSIAQL